MTDAPEAAPSTLPTDAGQALAAGSIDVMALLATATAGPLTMLDADLAAKTEEKAQALSKDRPEIAIARTLVLLTSECARWYQAFTEETSKRSTYVGEIADVLDSVVPVQLDAKNRIAAAANILVQRVKDLEAQVNQLNDLIHVAKNAGAIPATHVGGMAPRELTAHIFNGCNAALLVQAIDAAGVGGASHLYEIAVMESAPVDDRAASEGVTARRVPKLSVVLPFQKGAVNEVGIGTNGITHEALLAILMDRLDGFQSGPYSCPENQRARDHLHQALGWLHERTKARESRCVEGTLTV